VLSATATTGTAGTTATDWPTARALTRGRRRKRTGPSAAAGAGSGVAPPQTLFVTGNSTRPATEAPDEPVEGGVPAEGGVPWSRALEERLRAVVKEVDSAPWTAGDLALAAIPVGKRGANNSSKALVRELAGRVGSKSPRCSCAA
jgi:hypothetical protein